MGKRVPPLPGKSPGQVVLRGSRHRGRDDGFEFLIWGLEKRGLAGQKVRS